MPNPMFYSINTTNGIILIQIRPYTGCNEVLILNISDTSTIEREDIYPEQMVKDIEGKWNQISEERFREYQNQNFLKEKVWKKWYEDYYKLWKEYFSARSISVDNTRKSEPNFYYYDILEEQYKTNGVYSKQEELYKIEQTLKDQQLYSLYDIFKEARIFATHQYNVGKI